MKKRKDGDTKIPSPPAGLDQDLEIAWDNQVWRLLFIQQRSKVKRTLLINWLKTNLPPVVVAILIGTVLRLFTNITILDNSLATLSAGVMAVSATILAIMTAFLTFWFGNAINNLTKLRDMISGELSGLADIEEDIRPYTAGPKETIADDLKEKILDLAEKSKSFRDALRVFDGRFHRGTIGTYYNSQEMFKLETVIKDTGGKWFVSYSKAFEGHEARDFCSKTWLKAMEASRELNRLNDEIIRANGQLKDIIEFMPTMVSILFIFIFALVVIFLSNMSYSTTHTSTLLPLTKLIFASLLIVLLPVQLVRLVHYLWSLVSAKYIAYMTNSEIALRYSSNMERRYSLDYDGAMKREAETILDMFKKTTE